MSVYTLIIIFQIRYFQGKMCFLKYCELLIHQLIHFRGVAPHHFGTLYFIGPVMSYFNTLLYVTNSRESAVCRGPLDDIVYSFILLCFFSAFFLHVGPLFSH